MGAAGATAIAYLLVPGPVAVILLVLGFVWGAYGFGRANYAVVSFCITGYVVFLMTLAGLPESTAAIDRMIYTAVAGVLAVCAALSVLPPLRQTLATAADGVNDETDLLVDSIDTMADLLAKEPPAI